MLDAPGSVGADRVVAVGTIHGGPTCFSHIHHTPAAHDVELATEG